jgi:hypothetical protein
MLGAVLVKSSERSLFGAQFLFDLLVNSQLRGQTLSSSRFCFQFREFRKTQEMLLRSGDECVPY